jgi:hypothetical protein
MARPSARDLEALNNLEDELAACVCSRFELLRAAILKLVHAHDAAPEARGEGGALTVGRHALALRKRRRPSTNQGASNGPLKGNLPLCPSTAERLLSERLPIDGIAARGRVSWGTGRVALLAGNMEIAPGPSRRV